MDKAVEIATSFAPKVINLLNVPGQQQVMLKVKVAEVAKNFREELGSISWSRTRTASGAAS